MVTISKEQVCEQFGRGKHEFQQHLLGCWEEEEEEERLSKAPHRGKAVRRESESPEK